MASKVGETVVKEHVADVDTSIREFCELSTPIFMFDKDGAFVVMKLEQVCLLLSKMRSQVC